MNHISRIFIVAILFSLTFAQSEITVTELKEHNYFLSSKECEGRRPGSTGIEKAAEYIASQFRSAGLSSFTNDYRQNFSVVTGLEFGKENSLSINSKNYKLKSDFIPLTFSANKGFSGKSVFAGYGIKIKKDDFLWDDYNNLNTKGNWVVIIQGTPDDPQGKFVGEASSRKKALLAQELGAAGVIFINPGKESMDDKLEDMLSSRDRANIEIPVIQVKQNVGDEIVAGNDLSISDLIKHYSNEKTVYSFETETIIDAKAEVLEIKKNTSNIVGYLEGSDPELKKEFIVVGAHYDHLGWGGPQSGSRKPDTTAIHFGADDNASGTATIIEIAEKMTSIKNSLKRSIIFVAFSAEEMGIIGSKYFANNPPVDIKQITAMFNFDMVGRFDSVKNIFSVGGTGTAEGLEKMIMDFAKEAGINVAPSSAGYGPSDHASFYTKDIPVIYFFTSLHTDYHTPADTPDKINYKGQKLISDFAAGLLEKVNNLGDRLKYTEAGPKNPEANVSRPYKVSLGIMPDVASSDNSGLNVDGVTPGKAAAKAGIKKGDKIIAMNNVKIKNVYDYMDQLNKLKKGDKVLLTIIRETQTIEITVEL